MRSVLALGASALAGLAAVIASLDGDADIVEQVHPGVPASDA